MNADIVSMSFMGTGVIPVGAYIWTGDAWWLQLVGALFVANLVVAGLKEVVGAHALTLQWTARPAGAWGCDAFCMNGSVAGRPGFPSGHMTTVTMFVAILWLRFGDERILWVGIPWILAMAWARWAKRCHNLIQIAGGVATGVLGAIAFDRLL
jgi:membrane-associated phospholipid phosphatase